MAPRSRGAEGAGGADDYPYDASLRPEQQQGLDRLRTISDRKLAAYLYVLYTHAGGELVPRATPRADRIDELRRTAARALDGGLGPDAHELASYMLLDDTGRQRFDEAHLRVFAARLCELRRNGH